MRTWRSLGTILVCLCFVASSSVATGTTAMHTVHLNKETSEVGEISHRMNKIDDADASIQADNFTVTRGDEITFVISHSDPATVHIGGDEYGFNVTVELGGSGSTEITMDTRETTAANPDTFIDGGSATLHSDPLEDPIKPAVYPISVTIDGIERDVTTFNLTPREEMTSEGYRAPSSFTPNEYLGDGEGADANVDPLQAQVTAGLNVTRRSYAVVRIKESGLETALNTDDLTGSPTANGIKIAVTRDQPIPNQRAPEYVASENSRITVLPNLAADEIYIVWDTRGVELAADPARNQYTAEIILTPNSSFVDESTTLTSTTFTVRQASVSLSAVNGTRHYPWDPDTLAVEGQTNRAPQTPIEVRLRGSGSKSFLRTADTTANADGSFRATLDLNSVPVGADARLWIYNHSEQTEQTIQLVAPDPHVRINNQTVKGTTVTVNTAELPEGGYVYLKGTDGQLVGRSDYLAPGRHTNITAELATPLTGVQTVRAGLIRGDDEDSYDPNAAQYTYWQNDSYVTDTGTISVAQTPTETVAATSISTDPEESGTPTPTPYPVETRTPLQGEQASGAALPMSLAVTIFALVVFGAALARSR